MFKKVLIANRGEIACRIIRTLNCMGIQSVALYSEADENALHVELANETYPIGPSRVGDSYLNGKAILEVAQKSQTEAIHPGYGFLSENSAFAQAVQDAGIVFIGPSPEAISIMGDKLKAKHMALNAGVHCLPGCNEALSDLAEAQKLAEEIGYPLMVKAAAGGGGKGMRIVQRPEDLEQALKGTMREAESSFGDERIFLEKYIDHARHIEVQILADTQGNVIHLGERECSLQRRHQKVIEEAPSAFVTPELREQITFEAVRLAQQMNYTSAGTVEFVVDPNRDFYFLEMNTRLQVEHPTTELITGIDVVEEMIRIAAQEPLRIQQKDVHFKGHAIEARIYAEDSSRGFLPSTGHIHACIPPEEGRLDSGVREGDKVTSYYDPLIAKMIVWQTSRAQAIYTLQQALNELYIRGVSTNIVFLSSVVHNPFFKENNFDTTTLDQRYGDGFEPTAPSNIEIPLATAAVMHCIRQGHTSGAITVLVGTEPIIVNVSFEEGRYKIFVGDKNILVEAHWEPGSPLFRGTFNGEKKTLQIDTHGIHEHLIWDGCCVITTIVPSKAAELVEHMPDLETSDVSKHVLAPMPGRIIEVNVSEGDTLEEGQAIATIEAMKMENIIRSRCDGTVIKVLVKVGENVNLDQPLVEVD